MGVCGVDFGFDITVYVILASDLPCVCVCRAFTFAFAVCLCFFSFFLIKCRHLYFSIRCMSVHLYLPCCTFVYNDDLVCFLVVRLSLTWLCLCWSLHLPCVYCVCHLPVTFF